MLSRLFGPSQSKLIELAFRDVSEMLQQSAKMLDHALATLLDNQPLEVNLDQMDDTVDLGERMVRRTVLEHLAVNPQQDLVASLVLASMVQDFERIGDFARGLGELAELGKSPRQGPFRDQLKEMAAQIRPLFETCQVAFLEDDAAKARFIIEKHIELKQKLLDYVKSVADSNLSADMAVVYSGSANMLRRISAHLSNIATSVTEPYDQIRKGDETV